MTGSSGLTHPTGTPKRAGSWRPAPRVPGLEGNRSSKAGPGRGAPGVTPRSPLRPLGTEHPNTVNLPNFEETSDQIPPVPAVPGWTQPPASLMGTGTVSYTHLRAHETDS